ncbi:hypothetical protein [Polluticaenibacter yanchengensis]|uniref:Uncharacterized protein n=1 Tax=Polluticaenibacter yanchengensis TaxID=3014562 RepID=A0ABT4UID9_9BACT|nr:hypothetical protein [Chitinophagaceae bacterium LY-5]
MKHLKLSMLSLCIALALSAFSNSNPVPSPSPGDILDERTTASICGLDGNFDIWHADVGDFYVGWRTAGYYTVKTGNSCQLMVCSIRKFGWIRTGVKSDYAGLSYPCY